MTRPTTPVQVSVVIPARNDAPALDRCLRALGRQTRTPLEIIVVDNASTDDTAATARRHGARVVRQERIGIPQAAATGYDAARGDIIARLDADSVPGPDWVGCIADVLAGPAGRPGGRWEAITGVGRFYEYPRAGRLIAGIYLGAYYVLCHAALGHRPLWGSNMAMWRQTWLDVRAQVHDDDAELHDDLDLAFALGPSRPIGMQRSLVVGASARSLVGAAQVRRRFRRAFRTLRVNWAIMPPWQRWQMRWVR